MKTIFTTAGSILWLLFASTAAAAVSVNWQSTGGLNAGDSVVNTNGTLTYAYNLGDATSYTINTVPFTGTAGGAVSDLAGDGNVLVNPPDNGSNPNFSNLTGDFGSLIDSAAWGFSNAETTITLNNLTDGHTYVVQVFSSDVRGTRNNTLVLDSGAGNEFSSSGTGSVANGGGDGAHVTGSFVADSSGQATFTFRYLATSGNANINAIQVRDTTVSTGTFVHPGIGLSVADLNHVKANLTVEPWKSGYDDLAGSSLSSLSYTMQGPFAEVGHTAAENRNSWRSDMQAVHHLARMWYFTDDVAYAQKARDILISWATTHTTFLAGETYLDMGYHAHSVFEGAEILRGTWPGWTQADTDTCKTYFEDVWWDSPLDHLAVPDPLRSANQGMAQFAAALAVAVFNDDQVKFDQCLEVFRTDAPAALLSSLPNGQIGDSGRDAHDQGQLMLMAWCAETFWHQGVDVFSEYDNRLLAAAEYISRFNLLTDPAFIQAGTVYDIYPENHTFDGEYASWSIETKMVSLLYTAYVVRKGMSAPYLEKYHSYTTQSESSFCHLMASDGSSATPPAALPAPPSVASVTTLDSRFMGDTNAGSATYVPGSKTWEIKGNGPRMWYSDVPDYHFAYLEVTGDATIVAKLNSLSGGSTEDARAGLVFSTDVDIDSAPMQAIIVTHPDGSDPQTHSFRRGDVAHSHQGNSGSRSYPRQSSPKIPYWLKIERIGDRVNCYSSPDGISWSCGESADYAVGATAYLGLAVSSDQTTAQSTAIFSDVRITGGDGGEAIEAPEAPFAIYASPGCDEIPLRWLESFEADSYNIYRSTQAGGPFTTPYLSGLTGTSHIDTNVNFGTHYYYAVSAVNSMGESPLSPVESLHFIDTSWYEGEDYDAASGVGTEEARDFFGGRNLSSLADGEWARYDDVPLNTGAIFRARVAGFDDEIGQIEVRLGSTSGTLVGTVDVIDTNGTQSWGTQEISLSGYTAGVYDLYLVFTSVTPSTGTGFNLNWFDIVYAGVSNFDLGMDQSLTYDPASHELTNHCMITAWDATSTYLRLQDGSDLSNFDFTQLGITSWETTDFDDAGTVTNWNGANLSGITLHSDGNFGAGDNFSGASFSNLVWGTATSTADPAKFFSGGSGASSAATAEDAINFFGADLSLITGTARTIMINNLGGFDGPTRIGARFDPEFITNSGWDQAALIAAGWQLESNLLAHWSFNEGSGTTATDITGNGHDGTVVNAIWSPGVSGHSLDFNGSSAQVTNIGSAFSGISDQITISLWAYGDSSLPANNSVFYAVNGSGGRILSVHLPWGDGTMYWDAGDSGYDRIQKTATEVETEGSWAHWVFTKNSTTGDMRIYRNGTLWHSGGSRTKTMTGIANATIGSQISGAYYPGNIDEVRLYDVELDAAEVAALHASYPPNQAPTFITDPIATSNAAQDEAYVDTINGTATDSEADPLTYSKVSGPAWLSVAGNGALSGMPGAGDIGPNAFMVQVDATGGSHTATLNVTVDPATYMLTYTAGAGGTITGLSPQMIDHGTNGSPVTAEAEPNHSFVDWSDGDTSNPRTDLSVSGPVNVTANFMATYSDLENWRFANFGSYDNTGTAADDFDADFDGVSNLLEYATGTDPNTPGPSPLTIGPVSGGSGLELRFDRILDPSLNYLIEGTDNLEALSWDPVWTGTGTSAGPVPIPESEWPSGHSHYFFRLGVSY
ncbi:carbohydrate-binding protein [Haloferula sp.]|uniref:carbohydrate-binding protein n=1 Tax=Haloferula sp. TaxID=2497595 RepID=UPI0032A06AC9